MDASHGKLVAEITGEVETEGNVLILRRIFARYKLRAPESQREVIERVHAMHRDRCPVARSIRAAIEIHTSFELVS